MRLLSLFRGSDKKTEQETQSAKAPPKTHQPPQPTSDWVAATVKWYDSKKGFGFLIRGEGEKDISVTRSALKRCNIDSLAKGQKVEVKCVQAPKGPKAVELRLST